MRLMLKQKETNYLRLKRAKMARSMFEVIAKLGIGAFGEVSLVRKCHLQAEDEAMGEQLYAMKTLRKVRHLLSYLIINSVLESQGYNTIHHNINTPIHQYTNTPIHQYINTALL